MSGRRGGGSDARRRTSRIADPPVGGRAHANVARGDRPIEHPSLHGHRRRPRLDPEDHLGTQLTELAGRGVVPRRAVALRPILPVRHDVAVAHPGIKRRDADGHDRVQDREPGEGRTTPVTEAD